jgi:hypothetical protein
LHLFDLCESDRFSGARAPQPALDRNAAASVPEWVLGCFRRRSITFFTGEEDACTEVIWLQSRGLTADFRRTPPRVSVACQAALSALGLDELSALARVEGGFARTRWDGELMHWSDWTALQTHAKWPEPGRLARVGRCMVELAPSGAYVEDWRLQPCRGGPLIGLELIDERDASDGTLLHRGGGLIVCGEHAGFVRGRPEPLPEGERLEDFVRAHAGDPAALAHAFALDASYGTAAAVKDAFTVTFSTRPWREGEPLLSLDGFSLLHDGQLAQRVEEAGRRIERRFRIDTLERDFSAEMATSATVGTKRWFEREVSATLATPR